MRKEYDEDIIDYREENEPDGRAIAMLIYLLSFLAPILAPLLIWLLAKKEYEFVDFHGKQYFNFLISYTIYTFASSILVIVGIGFILVPIVSIMMIVFTIIGAVKSYSGEEYVIPLTIRFLG
ncbi:hypothetical protein JCM19046_2959 [Bacillus sp. JCM 19046]|nr:hypothetical protein JCM19045_3277 [Bacillus sp. JCM 19045]GAF18385.1 hypothetical protein JCM19046_2959 [Bacillus sp. JCM 19046]